MGPVTVKWSIRFRALAAWLGWEEGAVVAVRRFQNEPLPRPRRVYMCPSIRTSCPEQWGVAGTHPSCTAEHVLKRNLF